MFIEFKLDDDKVISVNMDYIRIIEESTRVAGHTALYFVGDKPVIQVLEAYEAVMAKVRIAK